MANIAFIAPFEEMYIVGTKIIDDLGLTSKIDSHLGSLNQGVAIARKAEARGVDRQRNYFG
jgi:hypothetical protein